MRAQIIRIFFVIAAVWVCCPRSYADLRVGPGVRLRNDLSGRDAEFLRRAVQQLERLRRLTRQKVDRSDDLVIIAGKDKFSFSRGEMSLPGNALRWESDPELRRHLYGVLAAHHFGIAHPRRSDGLPPWMVAGLDNGIMSAETAGQYIAGNSSYALLSSICADSSELPDFIALCRMKFPVMAVADDFAAEQARLLLEIFARNGRIRELISGVISGKSGDCWLEWYLSPADARSCLQRDAAQLLFDRFNPMPTATALGKISELETFFIPEIGVNGKPDGRVIEADVTVFCEKLAQDERPDRGSLRRDAAAKWRQLGRHLSLNEREICQQIANALIRAGEDDDVPAQFKKGVAELKKTLSKRQRHAAFLNRTLDRFIPPMLRLRMLLRAVDDDEAALSPGQREFFNRTLDLYLR